MSALKFNENPDIDPFENDLIFSVEKCKSAATN
jgi:hypothetical protein